MSQQEQQQTIQQSSRPGVIQYQDVCFTLWDYTYNEVEHLQKLDCIYMIFGKEESQEGRPHLQGFVILKRRYTLIPLKKLLCKSVKNEDGTYNLSRIHVEKRQGSRKQASNYCRGGGLSGKPTNSYIFECGEFGETKTELQIRTAIELHKLGASITDHWDNLSISDLKAYEKIEPYLAPPVRESVYVEWIWGESGAGKTRYVTELASLDKKKLFHVDEIDGFWSGYMKHPYILIDDFCLQESDTWYRCLLQVMDKYEYLVDKKYGGSWLYAERVYITAQHPPWYYWKPFPNMPHLNPRDEEYPTESDIMANEKLAQVMRRINKVIHKKYSGGRSIRLPIYEDLA